MRKTSGLISQLGDMLLALGKKIQRCLRRKQASRDKVATAAGTVEKSTSVLSSDDNSCPWISPLYLLLHDPARALVSSGT